MSGTERSGSAYRCRRCAPRSRPKSCLTHTVTHTGKRADGNNGTNRLRPHPFWTKNRRKALYTRGWKALRWLVALGAYEISEDVVTVHIAYMERQAQSNPTLCETPEVSWHWASFDCIRHLFTFSHRLRCIVILQRFTTGKF